MLGPVENLFWELEERHAGAFRVAALLFLEGNIEADCLRIALQRLQQRHPKLCATIIRERETTRRYHFGQDAPPIPFTIIDNVDEDATRWRDETRRLLQLRFSAAGPFAAVTVLRHRSRQTSELILSVHHAIADGLSAIMLVDDLLVEYANAETGRDIPALAPLRAVTAQRARALGGWRNRVWLVKRLFRLQKEDRELRQTVLPENREVPPQSQWEHWVFPRAETLSIVRRCRREQTSLSGVLLAATCCGLMECLPAGNGVFKCQFPFDLRDNLSGLDGPITPRDLGCFVSVMNEYFDVEAKPDFWELARRAQQSLETFVEHGGPAFYYNIAPVAGRIVGAASRLWKPPERHIRVTLLATNYGVVNTRDTYGSLRPQACTLIFRNDLIGPSLVMEGLVMGQRLNVGFSGEGLEPAFWQQLRDAVRRHLDAAGGR